MARDLSADVRTRGMTGAQIDARLTTMAHVLGVEDEEAQ